MNDNSVYWLILLNFLTGVGNFGVNSEILDEKKKHNIEHLLEDILTELVTMNERLKDGSKLSG